MNKYHTVRYDLYMLRAF